MNYIELIGVITGIICVWLTVKESIWNWPVGLINIVCLGWVFYNAHLYPDVVLHTIFFILSWVSSFSTFLISRVFSRDGLIHNFVDVNIGFGDQRI